MIDIFKSFCSTKVTFNEVEWAAMEKCISVKTLKKNQHFLRSGDVCMKMGFITQGSTRLYFLIDGVEVTKDFCFENNFTGSIASFQTRKPALFNVVAMEDTELITLEYTVLEGLLAQHHCWSNLIRIVLGHFAIRKENRETSFLLDTAEQRYLDLVNNNPGILQRVSLKYIASFLGLTPETVSRIRNKMVNNSLLRN
ncbi:MAG: Crp/Fnr family transcriptional regulator [Prolixibacteraceae bacterium]|nr:Crp/Fnr family transcriptional regulator [Prolixibacteraceae bacterium]